ncbi:hypothetical protein A0J61_01854 [Choanephora cucurbitarum]|uniref:F-box domain-containing protein n=1 Tax=Choanephora cucurbitarum TaxID=101091 RepID=A0A1C7NNP9_9FUNG|nr:hypothetical protein A0J61_01854 [Choanephora cucurbitarum]
MFWAYLPSELLQAIFSYLARRELVQCQLVCLDWSRMAQQALYKDVRIESSHQLSFFIDAISTSDTRPGHHLRKLYLNCCFDHELTSTLDMLTEHSTYIEQLELTVASEFFWHRLIEERKRGQWKHLKMIEFSLSRPQLMLYYEAILVTQDTIESLMICDSFFSQYPAVSLDTFARAKKLTLIKSTEMSLQELNQAVDALPQLTNLAVKSSPQFSDMHHVIHQDNSTLGWRPAEKLVRLQADLFQCTNETFLFIIEKFPNLRHISIDFLNTPTLPSLDLEIMNRFTDYLCHLDSFHVRQLVAKDLVDLMVMMIRKLGKRSIEFHASVDVHSNQTRFRELYLSCKKKKTDPLCKPEVNLSIRNKNRLLPLATILDKIGSFVTNFRLYNVSTSPICFVSKDTSQPHVTDPHYLSDILERCPQLTKLKLNEVKLIASDFKGDHPLDTLILNRCAYSPLILYQLSRQLPNLKHAIVSCSEIVDPCTFNPVSTASFFHIHMPYTSFDTFEFTRLSSRIIHSYMFLKLTTAQKTSFFKYDKKNAIQATEEEYEASIRNDTTHTIHIHCRSIALIQLSDFGHHVYHKII